MRARNGIRVSIIAVLEYLACQIEWKARYYCAFYSVQSQKVERTSKQPIYFDFISYQVDLLYLFTSFQFIVYLTSFDNQLSIYSSEERNLKRHIVLDTLSKYEQRNVSLTVKYSVHMKAWRMFHQWWLNNDISENFFVIFK